MHRDRAKKILWTAALLLPALTAAGCGRTQTGKDAQAQTPAPAAPAADTAAHKSAPAYDLTRCIYTAADSAKVESLLRLTPPEEGSDVLFFARRLTGVPYVGATLEKADPERLVVNLRELDCTTLVETVLALAKTRREGHTGFADYCANLEKLRYRGGKMDGYLSRLHYFSWWLHDNTDSGLVSEVPLPDGMSTPLVVKNHYMSRHAAKYEMLRRHPEWTDSIAAMERAANGPDGTYLAEAHTSLPKAKLCTIEDGDIIAIVTTKDGLDYSHLGFAVWGKDGKLHLLNASSIHHKVVEEPKTLRKYLAEHPSSIGIRLLRLK